MTTDLDTKKELRAEAKTKLLKIKTDKESFYARQQKLVEELELSSEFKKAETILLYYPLEDEFDLSSMIISNPNKRWVLPRPIGKGVMLLFEVNELHELKDAKYGVKVPPSTNHIVKAENLDLVIIPGLAFDKAGYRLGRGGGYYDRLLAKLPKKTKTIGVCPEEILHEKLPREKHDKALDQVISV